jgi:ABC-type glycerol-3-phosphate transport system permease component
MFYLFLQREGAEDILDFWLDVQQHENLCRAYFKDVRKSGRTIREDWPEYWEYARRRGSTYGTVVGGQPGAKRSTASTAEMAGEMQEKRGTAERSTTPDPRLLASTSPATAVGTDLEHALSSATPAQPPRSTTPFSLGRRTPTFFSRRTSRAPTIIPRSSPISRSNLVESAERIFLRYLSPAGTSPGGGESHEIYLPPALRLHSFPLSNATGSAADQAAIAQVPDMFQAQKEYCFRAMEQDAFPRFLRSKAFGNLTPMSALVRLVAGLISLWIGLATAFSLVFLDVKPKSVRFYLFIPFTFALLFLISHQYELDPILVFFGQSETTPFRTLRIREPYVRKLLIGRSIWVTILVAVGVAALTLLFWAVPGHRL